MRSFANAKLRRFLSGKALAKNHVLMESSFVVPRHAP